MATHTEHVIPQPDNTISLHKGERTLVFNLTAGRTAWVCLHGLRFDSELDLIAFAIENSYRLEVTQ